MVLPGIAAGPSGDPVACCNEAREFLRSRHEAPRRTLALEPGARKLFVDDEEIESIRGLERKLHQPKKAGAVMRGDRPWEGTIQTRTGPSWNPEKKLWMLWYFAAGGTGLATSKDGVHWEKPILGVREHKGSKQNNLVSESLSFAFYDPKDADPGRRYKGFVAKNLLNRGGFAPAFSADGVNWRVLDVVVPSQDEANIFHDQERGLYVFAVKHPGPYGRSVYLTLSRDFEHWTDPRDCLIFHADGRDQTLGRQWVERRFADPKMQHPEYNIPAEYSVQVYNMAVFRYHDLHFGLPAMFHQTGRVSKDWPDFDKLKLLPETLQAVRQYGDWTGFHHLQLTSSRDLVTWSHVGGRQPFIDASPVGEGNYDLQTIMPASPPVIRDNEIWFYYTGIKRYAYISDQEKDPAAICLAKLRLDGFVSLDGGETAGEVVTKPMAVSGRTLHVNVDAAAGDLRAEILDARSNRPLAGFSLQSSIPVQGDRIDSELRWRDGDVSSLQGKTVRLRLVCRKASLYSFWSSR